MEDKSLFNDEQPRTISEGLQNFIDAMVEEIVLEGKPFDKQKKYLRKFSENEGLDYEKLEADITTFMEILDSLKQAFSNLLVKLATEKGKECFVSDNMVKSLVSHAGHTIMQTDKIPIRIIKNGKFGFDDFDGEWDFVEPFSEGLAAVDNGRSGFINEQGEMVLPYKWWIAHSFREGLAPVLGDKGYGYIDKSGNLQIPCQWTDAKQFKNGMAAVSDKGKKGYINTSGKLIIPCVWNNTKDFNEMGFAEVEDEHGFNYYIDKTGKIVWRGVEFYEGLMAVQNDDGKYGYMNMKHELVIPYNFILEASDFSDGLAQVYDLNYQQCFINKNGDVAFYVPQSINPYGTSFSDGMIAVRDVSGKWGYMNNEGKIIIPFSWSDAKDFCESKAAVEDKNGKWGYIDKSGELIIPCILDDAGMFNGNIAYVKKDGKDYYVDGMGNFLKR